MINTLMEQQLGAGGSSVSQGRNLEAGTEAEDIEGAASWLLLLIS